MSSLADAWRINESDGDDLQFIGPLLLGQTKWLGAAVMRDGSLVGVPGHARQVLRVDPRLHRVTLLGRSRGQDVNRNGRLDYAELRNARRPTPPHPAPRPGPARQTTGGYPPNGHLLKKNEKNEKKRRRKTPDDTGLCVTDI